MYVVFLDESGSAYADYRSFRDKYETRLQAIAGGPVPPYPYFVLASVGLREHHLPMVDQWLGDIKRSFLGSASPQARQEYEIKGEVLYSLREGRTPAAWQGTRRKKQQAAAAAQMAIWRSLAPHDLAQLEESVFDLLGRLSPTVWVVVVRQRDIFRRFRERTWAPHYWALTYVQQRVVQYVQMARGAYERAMFLMDETSSLNTAAQFDRYLAVRETINNSAAWPVEFGRHLLDIPVSGKSHLHQGLQLADIVAHAVWRHVHKHDPLGWFGRIEPYLQRHWKTGTYRNAGLTYIY
ncbi:MAG: DUF3800 domain-containing protein [Armatimonadetes bacterium]|nr:DUF3800 domain-containing protein [Armatimonadota bacterium]